MYRRFLSGIVPIIICPSGCKECSSSDKCNTCNDGYYIIEDTKKCYNTIIENYYPDSKTLRRCHSNCKQCFSSQINDTYMNCETCYPDYYMAEDTKSCYNETIDNYYLDNDILKRCHPNCKRCLYKDNLNCIICKNNYFMTEDTKSCYNEIIDNYYLDNNILKKCHPKCKRCYKKFI